MDSSQQPSFSPRRKWSFAFDVAARTLAVLAVVVLANYLSGRHFHRKYLSDQTSVQLSPFTVNLVQSITNEVNVILFYNKDDSLYGLVSDMLNEYQKLNPNIRVKTVDYRWDAGEAQKIKSTYKLGEVSEESEKNLVIFDCEGRWKIATSKMIADYKLEQLPNEKEREFRRKLVAFNGEQKFDEFLLSVTSRKPMMAYYLQGHGEHSLASGDAVRGYSKVGAILQQNNVQFQPLSLLGTNSVPTDCDLLIIAGPRDLLHETELEKVEKYLEQGGRLFALLNFETIGKPCGLEDVLRRWNVQVSDGFILDPANSLKGEDLAIAAFTEHPVVNPLIGSMLDFIRPRSVTNIVVNKRSAETANAVPIIWTEKSATFVGETTATHERWPLAVAVEKAPVRDVVSERGATRLVVVGDSFFLCDGWIDNVANADFANFAINWLLDRTELVRGVGPRRMTEFRITMTQTEMRTMQWILLAVVPGAMLLLGGVVWLGRRK